MKLHNQRESAAPAYEVNSHSDKNSLLWHFVLIVYIVKVICSA